MELRNEHKKKWKEWERSFGGELGNGTVIYRLSLDNGAVRGATTVQRYRGPQEAAYDGA